MKLYALHCDYCDELIYRNKSRINESKKKGWKTYCSPICQSRKKNKQQVYTCSNPKCNRKFKRRQNQLPNSKAYYCSRSCAATVNNSKFPKRQTIIKTCYVCGEKFVARKKYCSLRCKVKNQTLDQELIIMQIQDFYEKTGRIPLKREFSHSSAARRRFGSWNKAIEAAGFEPNPVLFAKRCIANDGHECDSLSERIIDDWLFENKINHIRNYPYPDNLGLIADFVIGKNWVEFFGLHGVKSTYDFLRLKKIKIAKQHKIKLIEIFPKDLYPEKLYEILIK